MTSGTCCLPQWCVESWALVQQRRLCLEVALDKVYWFYIIYFYKKNTDRLFSCLLIDWDFTVVKGLRKGNKCIKLDQPKLERCSLLSFVMQPMRKAEGHEMWAARTKEKKSKRWADYKVDLKITHDTELQTTLLLEQMSVCISYMAQNGRAWLWSKTTYPKHFREVILAFKLFCLYHPFAARGTWTHRQGYKICP